VQRQPPIWRLLLTTAVPPVLPLRHDSFEIVGANCPEQISAAVVHVIHVQQTPTRGPDQPPQVLFPLDQWPASEILPVALDQVERIEICGPRRRNRL
jgi:hypothetical protein